MFSFYRTSYLILPDISCLARLATTRAEISCLEMRFRRPELVSLPLDSADKLSPSGCDSARDLPLQPQPPIILPGTRRRDVVLCLAGPNITESSALQRYARQFRVRRPWLGPSILAGYREAEQECACAFWRGGSSFLATRSKAKLTIEARISERATAPKRGGSERRQRSRIKAELEIKTETKSSWKFLTAFDGSGLGDLSSTR